MGHHVPNLTLVNIPFAPAAAASLLVLSALGTTGAAKDALAFESDIQPLLKQYCIECHGGEKVKGDVDFTLITSPQDVEANSELWEIVNDVIEFEDMPPEEEENRPTAQENRRILDWYQSKFIDSVEARPGGLKPRRLSAPEYRNTLRSLFGFDLEIAIIDTDANETEDSLVMKLLPTDPPGASGFINDTHSTPLSTLTWEQYAYLADRAIDQLFSTERREQLSALLDTNLPDDFQADQLTRNQARHLVRHFAQATQRRPLYIEEVSRYLRPLKGLSGPELLKATRNELRAQLVSPRFIYRGLLFDGQPGEQQLLDGYERAERLSYFLWEDMPDALLVEAAERGELGDPEKLASQVDRMLASPKAITLSRSFAFQWFGLSSINDLNTTFVDRKSYRTQVYDFFNYLFTENRPVMEFIDSDVAFINNTTARYYPKNRNQLTRVTIPKGHERKFFPNQKILLKEDDARGGILTLPGVLAMNRGPILRGTWMLSRILGEHIGEPPADIPPIEAIPTDHALSFRDRFEEHRSNQACARCHDRIDPLGFAMQLYDDRGFSKLAANYKPPRNISEHDDEADSIDTSGRLSTGETFESFDELKAILLTTKRRDIIRNAVEQTLSYALCRKLETYDRPTVDSITDTIDQTNGSWRDLFVQIALSLPFQEVYLSPNPNQSKS